MLILISTNILGVVLDLIEKGIFSFLGIGLGRNVITFGVDMSPSIKIDNRKKDIFKKGPTQGLEHTLSA